MVWLGFILIVVFWGSVSIACILLYKLHYPFNTEFLQVNKMYSFWLPCGRNANSYITLNFSPVLGQTQFFTQFVSKIYCGQTLYTHTYWRRVSAFLSGLCISPMCFYSTPGKSKCEILNHSSRSSRVSFWVWGAMTYKAQANVVSMAKSLLEWLWRLV